MCGRSFAGIAGSNTVRVLCYQVEVCDGTISRRKEWFVCVCVCGVCVYGVCVCVCDVWCMCVCVFCVYVCVFDGVGKEEILTKNGFSAK